MWMGELITQRGIGNGISLMIFASIVSRLPQGVQAWWTNPDQVFKVMMPFVALAVIAAVVFIQEGQRRIPIQYAKRVIGRRMTSGGQTYLPLRVNMAGVIPVIFAASIMAFPPTVGQLIQTPCGPGHLDVLQSERLALHGRRDDLHHPVHVLLHRGHVQPGRPGGQPARSTAGSSRACGRGGPTAEFLDRILARLTFPGALYLAAVAALPTMLINQTSANFYFGGTSLLIVVGVALDTMKQLEAQLMMRNYEGFLK